MLKIEKFNACEICIFCRSRISLPANLNIVEVFGVNNLEVNPFFKEVSKKFCLYSWIHLAGQMRKILRKRKIKP